VAVVPFYFAWVDPTETAFGIAHHREDEKVVEMHVEHAEGDFAVMTVVIKNPRIGLLAPARKTWAWLAQGTTPLFFGRLVGIPDSIDKEGVTLQFIARPAAYAALKEALAATMRTLPRFDPVFLTPEAQLDPDSVLEARPQQWHIDRVTHAVTASHILNGEDGLEEFFEDEVPYDSVQIGINSVPARTLLVSGDVSWKQAGTGSIDIGTYHFDTYSGKSLIENWPAPGTSLGGGWLSGAASVATDNYQIEETEPKSFTINWNNPAQKHSDGDTLSQSLSSTVAPLRGPSISITLTSGGSSDEGGASTSSTTLRVPLWSVDAKLAVDYEASRERKESVQFTLSANFQALVTLPGEEEVTALHVGGGDVGVPLLDASVPIGDVRNRSYFSTDRGLLSLEYLIHRGRSQLMANARAVQVSFDCSFARAVALSCRKNALLHDHRLPGGMAQGKIIKYSFGSVGGKQSGTLTIACSIGYGGTVASVLGTPTYVADGYVDDPYQFRSGATVVVDADVGYTVPQDAPNDDGLHFPLTREQILVSETLHGSAAAQAAALAPLLAYTPPDLSGVKGSPEEVAIILNRATEVPKQVEEILKANSVWLEIVLKNLDSGPFENLYVVDVTDMELPQGIDLEAPSTP
jgi:hypothetical protein